MARIATPYGDYCVKEVRVLRYANGRVSNQHRWPFAGIGSILSFGTDATGSMYVLSANGTVYRIVKVTGA